MSRRAGLRTSLALLLTLAVLGGVAPAAGDDTPGPPAAGGARDADAAALDQIDTLLREQLKETATQAGDHAKELAAVLREAQDADAIQAAGARVEEILGRQLKETRALRARQTAERKRLFARLSKVAAVKPFAELETAREKELAAAERELKAALAAAGRDAVLRKDRDLLEIRRAELRVKYEDAEREIESRYLSERMRALRDGAGDSGGGSDGGDEPPR